MNKQQISEGILEVFAASPENTITENPIDESVAGLVMFDAPIFGIGSAADPLFETFKRSALSSVAYEPERMAARSEVDNLTVLSVQRAR